MPDSLPVRLERPLRSAAMLAACCLVAGLVAQFARQDANWDLMNYHLYNPWAWLRGRYGWDLAPAQLQTFHNPLLDVPLYAMVAADWPPRLIAFVLALPTGIAAFFTWRIAGRLLVDDDARVRDTAVAAALVMAVTGANGLALLASSMNEWYGAAFVTAALWLLVRDRANGETSLQTIAAAGLLVGVASGLKLTAATYAVGFAVALAARAPVLRAIGESFAFGLCVLAGIAITAGAWMAEMLRLYGSPLFPYFNHWLRSPLMPAERIADDRFGPKRWDQWLTLPWDLSRPPPAYLGELGYRDYRALGVLLLVVALGLVAARARRRADAPMPPNLRATWAFIATFAIVSIVVWGTVHGIHRYLLPLEIVAGIAIAALVLRLTPPRARLACVVGAAVLVVATTRFPNWGRAAFGDRWLVVHHPPLAPQALVVLTADAPMSYVLTTFPPDARHVGIESNLVRHDRATGLRAQAAAIVDAHRGPIYQLTDAERPATRALAAFGLARAGDCGEVRSNLTQRALLLCPLERTAAR